MKILCVLLVFFCSASAFAAPFLNSQQKSLIDKNEIIAAELRPMIESPMVVPPSKEKTNITLSKTQQNKLFKFLSASEEIDAAARLGSCFYYPGAKFTISDQKEKLVLLLCFNCNLWAIASSDEKVSKYGDLTPQRDELISYTKEIFGPGFFNDRPTFPRKPVNPGG
jgi:hypothetical protein